MWMGLWGKDGIACENTRKTTDIIVDGIERYSMEISVSFHQPVDRMLIGRHESNSPSNNHYKESYKILWKKLLAERTWG